MPVHRTPALRKRLSASLSIMALTLALTVAATGPGHAQTPVDLYDVRNVAVDVSAASPTAARDQGVREAQRKAFDLLFDRLTVDGARTALPPVTNETIDSLVKSYEVQEERTSAARYLGTLGVRFNAGAMRAFLRGHAVAFAEVRSKPTLIIPIDMATGVPVLWQAETAWRQAWANLPPPGGLVPLAIPYGEAQDVAEIGPEQALSGDQAALRRVADRYGAGDVATVQSTPTPDGGVTIAVTLYPADGPAESFGVTQAALPSVARPEGAAAEPPTVTVDPTLSAAVTAVLHRLEERWTAATMIAGAVESEMVVTVRFADQPGWQSIRQRLAGIPIITHSRITSLSRTEARLDLRHVGNRDRVRLAMAQQDLRLEDGPDGMEVTSGR